MSGKNLVALSDNGPSYEPMTDGQARKFKQRLAAIAHDIFVAAHQDQAQRIIEGRDDLEFWQDLAELLITGLGVNPHYSDPRVYPAVAELFHNWSVGSLDEQLAIIKFPDRNQADNVRRVYQLVGDPPEWADGGIGLIPSWNRLTGAYIDGGARAATRQLMQIIRTCGRIALDLDLSWANNKPWNDGHHPFVRPRQLQKWYRRYTDLGEQGNAWSKCLEWNQSGETQLSPGLLYTSVIPLPFTFRLWRGRTPRWMLSQLCQEECRPVHPLLTHQVIALMAAYPDRFTGTPGQGFYCLDEGISRTGYYGKFFIEENRDDDKEHKIIRDQRQPEGFIRFKIIEDEETGETCWHMQAVKETAPPDPQIGCAVAYIPQALESRR